MKLTISGVTNSAAQARSPSFSRSSSSRMTTTRPARSSAERLLDGREPGRRRARRSSPPRTHQALKIPRDEIHLHVDAVRRASNRAQAGPGERLRDQRDLEARERHGRDRQGDAVQRDRALLAPPIRGASAGARPSSRTSSPRRRSATTRGDGVHVPLDEVPAQPVADRQRALEVHGIPVGRARRASCAPASRRPRPPRTPSPERRATVRQTPSTATLSPSRIAATGSSVAIVRRVAPAPWNDAPRPGRRLDQPGEHQGASGRPVTRRSSAERDMHRDRPRARPSSGASTAATSRSGRRAAGLRTAVPRRTARSRPRAGSEGKRPPSYLRLRPAPTARRSGGDP